MITGVGTQRDGNGAMLTASQNTYFRSLHYHGMETETNCWSGANSWGDAMSTFQQIYNHEIANTQCYNMWNMILDANYNYVSWMTRTQNSMITVTPATQTVRYNPEFYIMKHWSYYVRPGAVRVNSTNTNSSLRAMAFKNPDGTIILEVSNTSSGTISPTVKVGSQMFTPALLGSSVNTFNIGGNERAGDWVPGTSVQYAPPKKITVSVTGTLGVYDAKGRLVKIVNRTQALANGDLWDRSDASGRKAAPGVYIIINRKSNAGVQKVMCP
jgi:hypothetical protein